MNQPLDRYHAIIEQDQVTGIDFIHVEKVQCILHIYFFQSDKLKPKTLLGIVDPGTIAIRSVSKTKHNEIKVTTADWDILNGQDVLKVTTEIRGDFALYSLTINRDEIDPYFNAVTFSFKVNCPSDLDCRAREHECPWEQEVDFPIDYLARDFWSFRKALFDFASLRYPGWQERLEADSGIMLAEVMSALGDELAYYQDRVGREAYLETATQRRSVRRHARLIDYDLDDGQASTTWMDFTVLKDVVPDPKKEIPAGKTAWAVSDEGEMVFFEIGEGLKETLTNAKYYVNEELNSIPVYIPDENNVCLPVGCTQLYIEGHHTSALQSLGTLPLDKENGKWVLLQTKPEDASVPVRRHMVRLIYAEDKTDLLNGKNITLISWEKEQALPFEICMNCNLEVHGNMVRATAGITNEKLFIIGAEPESLSLLLPPGITISRALEREGRDSSVTYLFSLEGSEEETVSWLMDKNDGLLPEIALIEMQAAGNILSEKTGSNWNFRKSLVGIYSSDSNDQHFTLDDGTWKRVVGYQRSGKEIVHKDYASGNGVTVRFGDGEFGKIPAGGTIFKVKYRLGGGVKGNVPAGSITRFDTSDPSLAFIAAVTNPLPATDGRDPESLAQIKKLAPFRFRSISERAVIPGDYAQSAERLEWVQKAGASFRWTGSWLSAFVIPDPKEVVELTKEKRKELVRHLDRFRQAGREVHIMNPRYADIDVEITICVAPGSYRGEVKENVLEALLGKGSIQHKTGYFSPDHFTFGTLLNRSTLEAAIQSVPGVNTVMKIRYKRRGWFPMIEFNELVYDPGQDSIIRVENDPLFPDRGTVKLIMEGGA